jgi:hypothetical protein
LGLRHMVIKSSIPLSCNQAMRGYLKNFIEYHSHVCRYIERGQIAKVGVNTLKSNV